MKRIAVFPGSFDPVTRGHEDIILRALPLFDHIFVAIGNNAEKKYTFTISQRLKWIEEVFGGIKEIEPAIYNGLTVDFCRRVNANYIIRGLRTAADFEFERAIGQVNKQLYDHIETVFMLTTPELSAISSSIVRDIWRNKGDVSTFVPDKIRIPHAK